MNYSRIIEPHNGAYRALIPTLPNLSAEGVSRDDALRKARTAAETYLAGVEVISVEAATKIISDQRPGSPQSVLQLAGKFNGDEAAMEEHLSEIYAERKIQREAAENEIEGHQPGD